MNTKPIIDPANLPMWTAVTFIMVLLALGMGLTNLQRTTEAAVASQLQILELKQQIDALKAAAKPMAR
jgi:hypothetical protein